MPVNVLFCEGAPGSHDVRVLSRLLAGHCGEIRPAGPRYGMGERIKGYREALGGAPVFGLIDGDFRAACDDPQNRPRPWTILDTMRLGWRWERKEIENYLIDPAVVARALGSKAPDPASYLNALEIARDRIAFYQAARMALSASRQSLRPLSSSFGTKRGKSKYRFPEDLSETGCLAGIRSCVADHSSQMIEFDAVAKQFEQLRPECEPGGHRYRHYLCYFAGKDLALAAEDDLRTLGFQGSNAFLEKVTQEILRSVDDIGSWLPEWAALQAAVTDPNLAL